MAPAHRSRRNSPQPELVVAGLNGSVLASGAARSPARRPVLRVHQREVVDRDYDRLIALVVILLILAGIELIEPLRSWLAAVLGA